MGARAAAWCGNPQDWLKSIVSLNAYAGKTVRFRFRLGTDSNLGYEGWYLDEVRVQAAYVPAVQLDQIKGAEHGRMIVTPGAQQIEGGEAVVINDDVAVEDSLYTAGRRGTGTTVAAEKICGAAAERGFGDSQFNLAILYERGLPLIARQFSAAGAVMLLRGRIERGAAIHSCARFWRVSNPA